MTKSELIDLIKDYLPTAENYYKEVEDFFKKQTLKEAIKNAAEGTLSQNCDGRTTKFASHQHRVGRKRCAIGAKLLLESKFVKRIEQAQNFDDLMKVVLNVANDPLTDRLGDLWCYDTAQRIGFKLKIYPEEVYLQCGAKSGARQLVRSNKINSSAIRGKRHVPKNVFPQELSSLEPYLIENLLCVGKGKGWYKG